MNAPPERAIVFDCGADAMVGILHEPPVRVSDIGVLFVVGGPQYRAGSHRQFVLMARAFAARGYPVLRFDYRGMGDSAGARRTFERTGDDIQAAIEVFCSGSRGPSRVLLWGLCDAASAVLMHGGNDPRVQGLILANPWVRTEIGEARAYLRHYYFQRLLQRSFWRKVVSGGFSPLKSARELAAALERATEGGDKDSLEANGTFFIERMRLGLTEFRNPVLVLISERDLTARAFLDQCSADHRWRAAMAAPHVSVVRLKGADHTFSSRVALEVATESCLDWIASRLAAVPA